MKKLAFAVVAACGVFGFAQAEDLEVLAGQTYDLPATATYDNVIVHGTLNIPSGLTLTTKTLSLGPDEGDSSVINVLGTTAGSLKVSGSVTIGANGGTGKIVALGTASSTKIVILTTLTVKASAVTAPGSDYIDVLELGKSVCDLKQFSNESTTMARVIVDNGTLGDTQYWGTTRFVGGFRIEGRTATSTISFGGNWTQYRLNSGAMTIANCGNVQFTGSLDTGREDEYKDLCAGLAWENVGDFVLGTRQRVVIVADDVLPYGVGCGSVEATKSENWINVGNHCVHLNGLHATEIRGSAGGSLVFGAGDTDGVLVASVADVLKVEKVGSGTLTVDGESSVGTLAVSEGTVKVSSPLAVTTLEVAEDAVLEIDGQDLCPDSANVRGSVVLKNGGRLITARTTETDERVPGYYSAGEWTKDGSGTLILEDPAVMPSDVHVKAGTLAFSAAGYDCKLYRWNVTAWKNVGWLDTNNGADGVVFYLAELAFVDADSKRVGKGTGTQAAGTDPASLPAGKAAYASADYVVNPKATGTTGNLFDANQWPRTSLTSPLPSDPGGVTIYVRLKDDDNPVVAYDFGAYYGGAPKSWTMSGSFDDGATWEVLNAVENFSAPEPNGHWCGANSGYFGDTVPKKFLFNSANMAFTRPGVKNMPDVMQVEVANGATLDFSNVTGGQAINALTIDLEDGAGAISNCAFAAEGTVYVKNLGSDEKLNQLSIPLALGNAAGLENLANWGVVVNGVAMRPGRYKPTYKNGVLTFVGPGLMLILR